jgi:hypothetical protein
LTDKLTHALALATRGFKVFPLIENGKLPAIPGFQHKATTDQTQITAWFGPDPLTGFSPDYNIGVLTGGRLAVLDVDNKNGVSGADSLALLEMLNSDLPPTFTVTTPSGGKHGYYSVSHEVRNSAAKIGQGLDVRGWHGYVVGPGSTVPAGEYRAASVLEEPLSPAPAWLEDLFHKSDRTQHNPVQNAPKVETDQPHQIQRAIDYLKTAEPAVEGAGGDHQMFKTLCGVKDLGVSEQTATQLALEHYAERCVSSRSPNDLADYITQKIANAYRYGHDPVGIADPALDFEPITLQNTNKLYFEMFDSIEVDLNTTPLIEDYLDQHALSVTYGESNVGKTFVAVDLAFHAALGKEWLGKRVEQVGVVYIAAEGGKGIRKRIKALKLHHKTSDVPFAIVPCSVNLLGRNSDVEPLIKLIDAAALQMACPIGLVVIDTLSRAMAGANENASEDMTAFVAALDRIRAATDAHVMVVHHSGKDTAKGARGHSSLRAATDTELEVVDGELHVRKQRDMDYADVRVFKLQPVDIGVSRLGKTVTSCVVLWGAAAEDFGPAELTPDEKKVLDAVSLADAARAGEPCTAEVMLSYAALGRPPVAQKTMVRWLESLEQNGLVVRHGAGRWTRWQLVGDVA